MGMHQTVEQILQQLRDDEGFRQRFVRERDELLAQELNLDDDSREALQRLDVDAFMRACSSVVINQAIEPVA